MFEHLEEHTKMVTTYCDNLCAMTQTLKDSEEIHLGGRVICLSVGSHCLLRLMLVCRGHINVV